MQRTYWLGDRSRHLGYFGFLQKSRAAKKKSAMETSAFGTVFFRLYGISVFASVDTSEKVIHDPPISNHRIKARCRVVAYLPSARQIGSLFPVFSIRVKWTPKAAPVKRRPPTACRFYFAEFAGPPRLYLRHTPPSSSTC